MPNIKSAEKRVQIAEIRRVKNAATKSRLKTAVKKYNDAVQSGNKEDAKIYLINAISNVDKAAKKGVIHKNAAARKKSKLQKSLNKALEV